MNADEWSPEMAESLRRVLDRDEIHRVLCTYARAVDRGDWELLRTVYHPDGYDDHVDYRGGLEGLIEWLDERFAGVDNSVHFLGNVLIDQRGPDRAFAETYFVSSRLVPPTGRAGRLAGDGDALCRQSWGRYLDHFERRGGRWRIARRRVIVDSRFTSVAVGGARVPGAFWGRRDAGDPLYAEEVERVGEVGPPA